MLYLFQPLSPNSDSRSNGSGRSSPEAGFTLIELIVVLAIMGIILSLVTVNLAGQRDSRNLKIAQNQLVSTFRQVQSFALSSHILVNGQIADYYIVKFDTAQPTQYVVQAIYNANTTPQLINIQTVNLPPGIILAPVSGSAYPVVIQRQSPFPTQNITFGTTYNCALVAFKLPYAKILANNACSAPNTPTVTLAPSPDDYSKLLTFRVNVDIDSTGSGSTVSSDDPAITITLVAQANPQQLSKTVTLNGVTGLISFSQ